MAAGKPTHMTPRRRVLAAWQGEMPDRIPFAVWHTRLHADEYAPLLEAGACIIVKSHLYTTELEGVRVEREQWDDSEGRHIRTVYHTRAGTLQSLSNYSSATTWLTERLFKGPEDYDALIELIKARRLAPTYDRFAADDARHGEQSIARPAPLRTPMFEIIYELLGVEAYAAELADHGDAIDALYEALLAKRREALAVVAESPARYAVVEGNVSFEMVGPARFERYYFPAIEEACELLGSRGILTGAHMDGNNRMLAPLIAGTSLDVIEAHTPPPDCDLSLADARSAWPGKAIHLNFPSSLHLRGQAEVLDSARDILAEAAPGEGFVFGLTEDIPTNEYLPALARFVAANGATPLAPRR